MRFGSVDMFMEFGEWGFRIGRPVANESFLRALLTYGTFEKYVFFCPDTHHMSMFQTKLEELIKDKYLRSRVETGLHVALADAIRHEDFSIFHLGDFTYFMPALAGIRNRHSKRFFPITGITHSLDGSLMNTRYLQLMLAGLAPFDAIICTSFCARKAVEKSLTWINRVLKERFETNLTNKPGLVQIPLGLDEDFFLEGDRQAARDYLNIPKDCIVGLSVGRLSVRRKADWLPVLELLARMYAGGMERFIVIIAGGGDDGDIALLQGLIAKFKLERRVLLFPNFPADVKNRLYLAADFYFSLVDNFQETFGLNIIEAMASGLPVIASDFSGYRDLVRDGQNGFLIPTTWVPDLPGFLGDNLSILDSSIAKFHLAQMVAVDLERLRKAFTDLYENEDLRRTMGHEAKAQASHYRWRNIIPSYESLWSELSRLAQNSDLWPASMPDLYAGDPAAIFSHYPSRIISDSDQIFLTELGCELLSGERVLEKYEDIGVTLYPELEAAILNRLNAGSRSVKFLKGEAAKLLDANEGDTTYHLLWLLKRGAVRLG